jgi:hypothetical protein
VRILPLFKGTLRAVPDNGSSGGLKDVNSKVLAKSSSAPDEPAVCQRKHRSNCVNGHVQWRAMASSTR